MSDPYEEFERLLNSEDVPKEMRDLAKECAIHHVDVAPDFLEAMAHTFGTMSIATWMDNAIDYVDTKADEWTLEQCKLFLAAIYDFLQSMQMWYAEGLHIQYQIMGPNFMEQLADKDRSNMFRTSVDTFIRLQNRMRKYGVQFQGDERMN